MAKLGKSEVYPKAQTFEPKQAPFVLQVTGRRNLLHFWLYGFWPFEVCLSFVFYLINND